MDQVSLHIFTTRKTSKQTSINYAGAGQADGAIIMVIDDGSNMEILNKKIQV